MIVVTAQQSLLGHVANQQNRPQSLPRDAMLERYMSGYLSLPVYTSTEPAKHITITSE